MEQTAILDGDPVAVEIVTEVRREEALLKAGALQSAIFNSANFSSIATDAKGVIQIFNVGAERMLGYTAAEVMNKITPADISDPQEVIARAAALSLELATPITPGFEALVFKAARGIEDIYELTYIRKDGSRFPAVVSVTALRDAQGGIIGYLLIGTDNTARKQVEAERRQSTELTAANKELEAFSYSISHDLRAPLRGIDGFSRILLEEETSQLSEQAKGYLQLIRDNTQKMGQLVDDLLAFCRLSRQPITTQQVDVKKLVGECLDELLKDAINCYAMNFDQTLITDKTLDAIPVGKEKKTISLYQTKVTIERLKCFIARHRPHSVTLDRRPGAKEELEKFIEKESIDTIIFCKRSPSLHELRRFSTVAVGTQGLFQESEDRALL